MNAIMPRSSLDLRDPDLPRRWEGLTEIDRAVRDNRVIEYRVGKAWSDPWGKRLTIVGTAVIIAVFGFLIGAGLGYW